MTQGKITPSLHLVVVTAASLHLTQNLTVDGPSMTERPSDFLR